MVKFIAPVLVVNEEKSVTLQRLSKQEQRPSFTWTIPSKQDVLSETQKLKLGAKWQLLEC